MIGRPASMQYFDFHWSASLKEAGLLLLISILATWGWWLHGDDRLPLRAEATYYELEIEAPLKTIEAALAAYDEGQQLFVDTRRQVTVTIPGSFFIREDTFDDDLLENFDFMLPEDELILFGDGNLAAASNIAGRLHKRGFDHVTILKGGLSAWEKAGGEVSTSTGEP